MEAYLVIIKDKQGGLLEEIHSDSFNKAVYEAGKAAKGGDVVEIYEGQEDALGMVCNHQIIMTFTQDSFKDYDQ